MPAYDPDTGHWYCSYRFPGIPVRPILDDVDTWDESHSDCSQLFMQPREAFSHAGNFPDHVCDQVRNEHNRHWLEKTDRLALDWSAGAPTQTISVGRTALTEKRKWAIPELIPSMDDALRAAPFVGSEEAFLIVAVDIGATSITAFCTIDWEPWQTLNLQLKPNMFEVIVTDQSAKWEEFGLDPPDHAARRRGTVGPVRYLMAGDPDDNEVVTFRRRLNHWWAGYSQAPLKHRGGRSKVLSDREVEQAYRTLKGKVRLLKQSDVLIYINRKRFEAGLPDVHPRTLQRLIKSWREQKRNLHLIG